MKRSWNAILCLAAVISLSFAAACGVTETGNVCPGSGCEGAAIPHNSTYTNDTYGVQVAYDALWRLSEIDAATIEFTMSGEAPATTVRMEFSRLDPEPASLLSYLAAAYPTDVFTAYDTATLAGYLLDEEAIGDRGGELQEYFFLEGAVLIHVSAELFGTDAAALEELLNGVSFAP